MFHLGKESPTWRTLRKEVETGSSWKIEWKRASNVSEAARESRLIQFAPGSEKTSGLASVLVSVEGPIRDVDVPILMGMLVDGVSVIVAKGAINDAIWTLKSEATRLALPFEVAESRASFWHLILASIGAVVAARARMGAGPHMGRRVLVPYLSPATAMRVIRAMSREGSTDLRALLVNLLEVLSEVKRTGPAESTVAPKLEDHEPQQESSSGEPLRSDVLGTLPGVVSVTRELRSESGRLDADKISELFGMTRSELARLARITAEAIRQTPDSARLQPTLSLLERCARLLVLNPDRANFRAWLNTQNPELGDQTPLETIKGGKIELVADLVEDVLTNRGG